MAEETQKLTTACPMCGCTETEQEGDCPAGNWWSVCARCRLPVSQWVTKAPEFKTEPDVKPRLGVATIVMNGHNVLLGRSNKEHTKGQWVIPGGKIEPFETIKETSTRELFEEAGITVGNQEMLFISERVRKDQNDHRYVIYVIGQYLSGDLKAGGDLDEVRWVDPRELGFYQNEMSEMTVEAFMKFSMVLRSKAGQHISQMDPPTQVN